jgi:hypothetical protein
LGKSGAVTKTAVPRTKPRTLFILFIKTSAGKIGQFPYRSCQYIPFYEIKTMVKKKWQDKRCVNSAPGVRLRPHTICMGIVRRLTRANQGLALHPEQ